jgi:hypothetical protein
MSAGVPFALTAPIGKKNGPYETLLPVLTGGCTGKVPTGAGPLLFTVLGSPMGFTVLLPTGYVTVVPSLKVTVSTPAPLSAIAVDNPEGSIKVSGLLLS